MSDATVKDVEKLQSKSSWEPEIDENGRYVWHYCKYCGIAMNMNDEHKPDCRAIPGLGAVADD